MLDAGNRSRENDVRVGFVVFSTAVEHMLVLLNESFTPKR